MNLHIYTQHCKLQLSQFLLPVDATLLSSFEQGYIPFDLFLVLNELKLSPTLTITDHRKQKIADYNKQSVSLAQTSIILQPSHEIIQTELQIISNSLTFSQEESLEFEAGVVCGLYPRLNLSPNPNVSIQAGLESYNKRKFSNSVKATSQLAKKVRTRMASVEEQQDKIGNGWNQTLLNNKKAEFHGTFSQIGFIESWRRRKESMDREVTIGVDPKNNMRRKEYRILVRTVRFERMFGKKTEYTMLNIYQRVDKQHEGMLKIGNQVDTSVNGQTLHFLIGNEHIVHFYVENFKKIYSLHCTLTGDMMLQSPNVAGAAASYLPSMSAPLQQQHFQQSQSSTSEVSPQPIHHIAQQLQQPGTFPVTIPTLPQRSQFTMAQLQQQQQLLLKRRAMQMQGQIPLSMPQQQHMNGLNGGMQNNGVNYVATTNPTLPIPNNAITNALNSSTLSTIPFQQRMPQTATNVPPQLPQQQTDTASLINAVRQHQMMLREQTQQAFQKQQTLRNTKAKK